MRTANRFMPARRPNPAGATAIELVSVPPMWISWLYPTRRDYLRAAYPQLPGESDYAYETRLRGLIAAMTTRALFLLPGYAYGQYSYPWQRRSGAYPGQQYEANLAKDAAKPAGDANLYDYSSYGLSSTLETSGTDTGSGTSTDKSGLTDTQVMTIANTVGSILGRGADIVVAAMRGSDARAVAQIQSDAAVHLQELRNQQSTTTDPGQQSVIGQQIAALQAALAAMAANTGMSTTTMIALGIGGVAVVGALLYFAMRRPARHNPVLYRRGKHHHLEPYKFVSARHLRKMQRSK